MGLNKEAIKNHMKYLQNDKHDKEFYVALLLYDILNVKYDDITEKIIDDVYEIQDEYDSIYNVDMRERIIDLENEKEFVQEEEQEYEKD